MSFGCVIFIYDKSCPQNKNMKSVTACYISPEVWNITGSQLTVFGSGNMTVLYWNSRQWVRGLWTFILCNIVFELRYIIHSSKIKYRNKQIQHYPCAIYVINHFFAGMPLRQYSHDFVIDFCPSSNLHPGHNTKPSHSLIIGTKG